MSGSQSAWPREIFSTEQVRGFDRYAIDELGIAGFELMQRAGRAALRFLQAEWPQAQSVLIYSGAGNNAGDGYVLAKLAVAGGLNARVVAVVDPEALQGDAAKALVLARDAGVEIADFAAGVETGDTDLIVDALLGTGLTRDVGGSLAQAVKEINSISRPVLALDIPTGVDSDTGAVRGVAVKADATITFVGLKAGLYLGSGPAWRGRLGFSDLGLPPAVYESAHPLLRRLDVSDSVQLLQPRLRTAHKGLNGKLLVVGGAEGMANEEEKRELK